MAAILVIIIFIFLLVFFLSKGLEDPSDTYLKEGYKYFSCGMENGKQIKCFIFRGKTIDKVVKKIKRLENYGWYYDSVVPLKEITMDRAKELISVGARFE